MSLGPREALLWMHGDVQGVNERGRSSRERGARHDRCALCVMLVTVLGMTPHAPRWH